MAFYSGGEKKSKQDEDAEKKLEGRPDLKPIRNKKEQSFGVARRTLGKSREYESEVFIKNAAKIVDFMRCSGSVVFITHRKQYILSFDPKKNHMEKYSEFVNPAALLAREKVLEAFNEAKKPRVDDPSAQGAGATKLPWDTGYERLGSGDKIQPEHFDFSEMSGKVPAWRP